MNLLARQFRGLIEAGLPFFLVQILFISCVALNYRFGVSHQDIIITLLSTCLAIGLAFLLGFMWKQSEYLLSAMFHSYATAFAIILVGYAINDGIWSMYVSLFVAFFTIFVSFSATDHNKLMKNRLWDLATPLSVGTALYMFLSDWHFFTFETSWSFNINSAGIILSSLDHEWAGSLSGEALNLIVIASVWTIPTIVTTAIASIRLERRTPAPKTSFGHHIKA